MNFVKKVTWSKETSIFFEMEEWQAHKKKKNPNKVKI